MKSKNCGLKNADGTIIPCFGGDGGLERDCQAAASSQPPPGSARGDLTIVVIGRQSIRSLCYENRDNLFYERVPKSIRDCALAATWCKILYSVESYSAFTGIRQIFYWLQVECNMTRVLLSYKMIRVRRSNTEFIYVAMSRWNVREFRLTECYSYIPLSSVSVTALLEPFSLGVWSLVLGTVIILATAWSLIVRTSVPVFLSNTVLSIITVRVTELSPRRFSSAAIGCATLSFTLLIGQLYSNSVMSSFLDPTTNLSRKTKALDCLGSGFCNAEGSLDVVLNSMPACHVLPQMLALAKRPLRLFRPRDLHYGKASEFDLLLHSFMNAYRRPVYWKLRFLHLVPAQTSIIWDRILQHGVISPPRLAYLEGLIFSTNRVEKNSEPEAFQRREKLWYNLSRKNFASRNELRGRFVSFNTSRELFDMISLQRTEPLFGICFTFIMVGMSLEFCSAQRIFLIRVVHSVYTKLLSRADRLRRTLGELLEGWMNR